MALIFHLSSQSQPLPRITALIWDKLLHLVEYGGLALLFCRALRGEGLGWAAAIGLAIVLTSAYAGSDEWHQAYVPLRTADAADWLADTIGATLGAIAFNMASRLQHRLRR